MANPFSAQQVGGAHHVTEADEPPSLMGLPAANTAADAAAVAIDHRGGLEIGRLQHLGQFGRQGRLAAPGIDQPANAHLELVMGHRENPAIALLHPETAKEKGESITPDRGLITR